MTGTPIGPASGPVPPPTLRLNGDVGYHLRATASYTDGHGRARPRRQHQPRQSRPEQTARRSSTRPQPPARSPKTRERGENIGAPVTARRPGTPATPPATLWRGADLDSFDIDSASGQIQTKQGVTYDHETKSSYSVTVKADDNNGGTATIDVTITVADVQRTAGVRLGHSHPRGPRKHGGGREHR